MPTNARPRKNAAAGFLPPQSIESEEALLGALMIDNSLLNEVVENLHPEDFYSAANREIFAAMIELSGGSRPIDLLTLTHALKGRGGLEKAGGAAGLSRLVNEVPMAVNAGHYAEIVYEKALRRRLIENSHAVAKRCLDDRQDVEEILDFADGCLFEITARKSRKAVAGLSELLPGGFAALQERERSKGMPTGVPSGFRDLDRLTGGLQKSDLIILAARPSMGKTALALNIARNAAVKARVPTVVFSIEMCREQLVLRLLCAESRVNANRFRDGFLSMEDWERLHEAGARLHEAPIFIDDASENSTLAIRAKTRRLKAEKGIGLAIIDYLQLIKVERSRERRDLDLSEISRGLKSLARELEIPVMALSQLNRQIEKRDDKRPQLSDLRESGALEQDADLVAFIHREEVFRKTEEAQARHSNRAEIILAKQRNGPTGSVKLAFLKEYSRFENLQL
jgi:replicative DNA helicase